MREQCAPRLGLDFSSFLVIGRGGVSLAPDDPLADTAPASAKKAVGEKSARRAVKTDLLRDVFARTHRLYPGRRIPPLDAFLALAILADTQIGMGLLEEGKATVESALKKLVPYHQKLSVNLDGPIASLTAHYLKLFGGPAEPVTPIP